MKEFSDLTKHSGSTRQEACETHGAYTSKNFLGNIWSKCPVCVREENEKAKKELEEAERLKQLERHRARIGGAGVPTKFQDRHLEAFNAVSDDQKHVLKVAYRYVENFDKVLEKGISMIFCGRPGTGKTHIACGMAMKLIAINHTVLFTTVFKAIRRVKETWTKGSSESESSAMLIFTEPELLILDEIGVQFGSDAEKLILFEIINTRYENNRPTILMSNLPPDHLAKFLGDRVWDRLRDNGGMVLTFPWDSHRA